MSNISLESLWQKVDFNPNKQQREAIEQIEGPLFLPAGPGSGKTRVLLWRTVNLIVCHGIRPDEIFLSTFTEKAAFQLKRNAFDLEELFPPEKKVPQRELVDACDNGLYDKMQVDSEVESKFVERHLRKYPNVVLYFKFPPKFKLDFPSVIHDYNPDWGIIRQADDGNYKLELVVETKGTTDIKRLRFSSEGWKILCAERYFEKLGIGYKFSDAQTFDWNTVLPKIK